MLPCDTLEPQDNHDTLMSSHAIGLDELIHPPGCSDPNCLLPSCINIKLRRNHLQTCRKRAGRCDICKLLKSNEPDGLNGSPPSQSVKHPKRNPKQAPTRAFTQNEDVDIVKVVKAGDRQENNFPESQSSLLSKQLMSSHALGEKPASRAHISCSAVLARGETAVNFQHQEQKHFGTLQLGEKVNDGGLAIQGSNQVVQSPLEVLCNALQALNTVIQLVAVSQLEMHVIPIFRQALAGMEAAVLKRLEENIGPRPLMLNNSPMVLGYFDNDITKPDTQWMTSLLASTTPLLLSSSPPPPPAPPPPLSSSSSSSSLSSLSSSPSSSPPSSSPIMPLSFAHERGHEYVPGGANQCAEHIAIQHPCETMLNPVVEMHEGDPRGESHFDLQDVILLDFVEELLG